MSDVDVEQLLARHAASVDDKLQHLFQFLCNTDDQQSQRAARRWLESMHYSLTAGGKRLRPALVLECHHACGGRDEDNAALIAAAAIELVHTFSLVHDDLPAMDDDDLRRGKPTNHKVFGEATAILAGDGMLAWAFGTLAGAPPETSVALTKELTNATLAMIAGQSMDMEAEQTLLTLDELRRIHKHKTGALITAACRMGGITAGASDSVLRSLAEYGGHVGTAFQIVDDILDETSTPQELGKQTHKDAGLGKNTYPRLLGLDASRQTAADHIEKALAALHELGSSADGLRALARFIINRSR